jgi:hypothetical protein
MNAHLAGLLVLAAIAAAIAGSLPLLPTIESDIAAYTATKPAPNVRQNCREWAEGQHRARTEQSASPRGAGHADECDRLAARGGGVFHNSSYAPRPRRTIRRPRPRAGWAV